MCPKEFAGPVGEDIDMAAVAGALFVLAIFFGLGVLVGWWLA